MIQSIPARKGAISTLQASGWNGVPFGNPGAGEGAPMSYASQGKKTRTSGSERGTNVELGVIQSLPYSEGGTARRIGFDILSEHSRHPSHSRVGVERHSDLATVEQRQMWEGTGC